VLFPLLQRRIKEPDERAAFRAKSAEVRSFVSVTVVTGESEISVVVTSAMPTSDDVFDVKGEEWPPGLAEGNLIHSGGRHVHERFAGVGPPSGSMAFSQQPTRFACRMATEFPTRIIAYLNQADVLSVSANAKQII
jgi:hypothetical protein